MDGSIDVGGGYTKRIGEQVYRKLRIMTMCSRSKNEAVKETRQF